MFRLTVWSLSNARNNTKKITIGWQKLTSTSIFCFCIMDVFPFGYQRWIFIFSFSTICIVLLFFFFLCSAIWFIILQLTRMWTDWIYFPLLFTSFVSVTFFFYKSNHNELINFCCSHNVTGQHSSHLNNSWFLQFSKCVSTI